MCKAKGGSTMYFVVENDGVKAGNDKIMFLAVIRVYTYWKMYSISINLYLCCLKLYFSIKPEIGIASFLSCLGAATKDKKMLPMD